MSSHDSTSAASPAAANPQGSSDTSSAGDQTSTQKAAHKTHHAKAMGSTNTSGSKSTDHDAEKLNEQELGKIQSPS